LSRKWSTDLAVANIGHLAQCAAAHRFHRGANLFNMIGSAAGWNDVGSLLGESDGDGASNARRAADNGCDAIR
jgi:hypothetical protein